MCSLLKSFVPDICQEMSEPEQALLNIYAQMEEKLSASKTSAAAPTSTSRSNLGSSSSTPLSRDTIAPPWNKKFKVELNSSGRQSLDLLSSPVLAKEDAIKKLAEINFSFGKNISKESGFKKTRKQEQLGLQRRESFSGLQTPTPSSPETFTHFNMRSPLSNTQSSTNGNSLYKQSRDEYRRSFIKKATLSRGAIIPTPTSIQYSTDDPTDSNFYPHFTPPGQLCEEDPLSNENSNNDSNKNGNNEFLHIKVAPSPSGAPSTFALNTDIIRTVFSSYGTIKTLIDKGSDGGVFIKYENTDLNAQVVADMHMARITGIEIWVIIPDKDKCPVDLSNEVIDQPWTRIAAGISKKTQEVETNVGNSQKDIPKRGTNYAYKYSPLV